MAEHWPCVPEALNLIVKETVLLSGTNATCSALWTKCQTITVTIFEGVHLLLYDIGYFTNGAFKQFGLLYDGSTDLGVPIGLQDRFLLEFLDTARPVTGLAEDHSYHEWLVALPIL
jgi:hypothetical protein